MAEKRINIEEVIRDIKKYKLDDLQIMQKYQLDYKQFVFVLGILAYKKQLPVKQRMINAANSCLIAGDLEKAMQCLEVIEKHFPNASGVKTFRYRVANAFERRKSQEEFQKKMQNPSPTLIWFKDKYPDVILHPEIERMIKVTDIFSSTSDSQRPSIYRNLMDPKNRLKMIAENNHLFTGLSDYEANRMWHYITLVILAENGIKAFFSVPMNDRMVCDVCGRISFTPLPVMIVRENIMDRINSNNFLPKMFYPSVKDIDNMPPGKKAQILMENGWYLPPFCDNCRCQIEPTIPIGGYFGANI